MFYSTSLLFQRLLILVFNFFLHSYRTISKHSWTSTCQMVRVNLTTYLISLLSKQLTLGHLSSSENYKLHLITGLWKGLSDLCGSRNKNATIYFY